MFISANMFVVRTVEDQRLLGFAVVCIEARYASARWMDDDDRVDRLHVMSADWAALGREIGEGLKTGPIPTTGTLYMTLAGERAGYVIIRWLRVEPVDVARPETWVSALNAKLTEVVGRSLLRSRIPLGGNIRT